MHAVVTYSKKAVKNSTSETSIYKLTDKLESPHSRWHQPKAVTRIYVQGVSRVETARPEGPKWGCK